MQKQVYIYIHIYIHTHIYIYIYMYTHKYMYVEVPYSSAPLVTPKLEVFVFLRYGTQISRLRIHDLALNGFRVLRVQASLGCRESDFSVPKSSFWALCLNSSRLSLRGWNVREGLQGYSKACARVGRLGITFFLVPTSLHNPPT